MDALKRNEKVWNAMPIKGMHADSLFIRVQKWFVPHSKGRRLLYIGFGEGQNLEYLAEEGFDCYGTEIARSRIMTTKKRLRRSGHNVVLKLVNSSLLPFPDNFFDVVVAWQSLCYNDEVGLHTMLDEILRVLKPEGQFISSMPSTKHKLCGRKAGRAPHIYAPADTPDQETAILYCVQNKRQLKTLYSKFKHIQIGYYICELFGGRDFHYVIYSEKVRL